MRSIGRLGGVLRMLMGGRSSGRLGILTYHRVAPKTPRVPAPTFNVTPRRFREHIEGLLRRGFRFISLRRALESHAEDEPLPPRSVVVTFDDCFETVYTQAWPVMKELSIPATLFLSTAYLDDDLPFPFDTWGDEFVGRVPTSHYRPIRTDQCREMVDSGLVELGTHTHTHADFRSHLCDFVREMRISARILQERFGVERPPFALPFGSVADGFANGMLIDAARRSGASCALTTEVKLVDTHAEPFGWGRLNAFCWDTSTTLAGKLSGWYDWAPQCKYRLSDAIRKCRAAL